RRILRGSRRSSLGGRPQPRLQLGRRRHPHPSGLRRELNPQPAIGGSADVGESPASSSGELGPLGAVAGGHAGESVHAVERDVESFLWDDSWSPGGGPYVFVVDDVFGELRGWAEAVEAPLPPTDVRIGQGGEDLGGYVWSSAAKAGVDPIDVEP